MPIYKGQTKIVKLYKGSTQIVKRYKGTNLIYSASRLPSAFQEVEYLESTGTQWIDTGFTPNQNSKVIIVLQSLDSSNKVMGCANTSIQARFAFGIISNTYYFLFNTANNTGIDANTNQHKVVLDAKNRIGFIDNHSISFSSNLNTPLANFALFAGNNNGNIYDIGSWKLYSSQIYDDDVLIRDFVPCYRKADNVAGLYDLVNGVFYTNAGTGTFIVGGNV